MTQISVTRALAQVKNLNDRIARATAQPFVVPLVGGKHRSGKPAQEVTAILQANLQSVTALIAERTKLKSAIVRSNAVTTVSIGGKDFTVAEAIERKGSIQLETALLAQLRQQLNDVTAQVVHENLSVQSRLDDLIRTVTGKDGKTSEADQDAITRPFKTQNEATILDPNKLQAVINSLESDIDTFTLEVDFALSESNALTKLEV